MNETQIERIAEHRMDLLDADLMGARMTQEDYDTAVRQLDRWCTVQTRRAAQQRRALDRKAANLRFKLAWNTASAIR